MKKEKNVQEVEWITVPYFPKHHIIWTWLAFLGLVAATKHDHAQAMMLAFGIVFGLAFYVMRTKETSMLSLIGSFLLIFAFTTELGELTYMCAGPLSIAFGKEILYWS